FNLVQDFGSDRVYRLKSPREISKLKELIRPGSSLLLGDPGLDPARVKGGLVYGGYMAALAYYLRDHTLYGDSRLNFGQDINSPDPARTPDYALLWANQDPSTVGF